MKINKLFHILVVTGASTTAGLAGCGDEKEIADNGGANGGTASSGGAAGATSNAGSSGASSNAGSSGASSNAGSSGATSSGGSSGATSSGGSSGATSGGGSSGETSGGGSSGETSGGGTAGSMSGGGTAGGGNACEAQCEESACGNDWVNCNGCCCWLSPGQNGICGPVGCPNDEGCCEGRGR